METGLALEKIISNLGMDDLFFSDDEPDADLEDYKLVFDQFKYFQ